MPEEVARSEGLSLLAELERTGAVTLTSLTLPPGLPFDQYEALFGMFGQLHEASSWLIGDLLNYGEKIFGETYAQAAEATGLAPQTLTNYASVCSRIPRSRRRSKLPFSVHAEVAYLSPGEQEKWLKLSVEHGWRRSQLREALQPFRLRSPIHHVETPQAEVEPRQSTIVDLGGGITAEILPPAVDAPRGAPVGAIIGGKVVALPHICHCMECGRAHRNDMDVIE